MKEILKEMSASRRHRLSGQYRAFIAELPADMPAREVVRRAHDAGLTGLSISNVYQKRSEMRKQAGAPPRSRGQKAHANTGNKSATAPAHAPPPKGDNELEATFLQLAVRIGTGRCSVLLQTLTQYYGG